MAKTVFIKDTAITGKDRTRDFYGLFLGVLREKGLDTTIQLVRLADMGIYSAGIAVRVLPDNHLYTQVGESDIAGIVESIKTGQPYQPRLTKQASTQMRIVLRNCGVIDPEKIEDYIAHDGYHALARCLTELTPEQVIQEMKTSGLRGRGGAGFPTGMKWEFTRKSAGDQRYIICNGDEGDPGAYMDRSVLEGDPHSVIEGMAIGGYAIGASKGFFYIRAEYPLAIERIEKAIKQCHDNGLLGSNILGSQFSFDVEIRLGAGAFVCGEETALLASIEGKRGYPSPRPPFPSVKGLWGKPTCINNVETLANIPVILFKGGEWFSKIGTETSKGTKVFAVTGKVKRSGLVEVPMGTTIEDIVYGISGGAMSGKSVKAIQTGGPSGGVIPKDYFQTRVDYESLQKMGSIMGSGGMIVMDEDDCMIDIAKFYLGFCVDESCGKCAPCRIGGTQMLRLLEKISEGRGVPKDLEQLAMISRAMQKASLCGLGQTAPNPVLSTLNYYRAEYDAHVNDKKCPACKCSKLLSFLIRQDKCVKCGMCFKACPVGAISGNREKGYVIDQEKCIRCGQCFEVCKPAAVLRQ
ncbi:MAG TPA: NADH-ubiquinone oxidoreductase-F iron-sulfur binding region domain-containing protein [Candidatus Omnitrophota bacterium]|nr:MAG: NADP-reducing hydrogenase subunit HndC [Candidatus Omnitrophica bacterium ADurb.Bin314]HOE68484.1 NADH-ubiquinone oxidoreductase-F iron-sulfur binding region domain-containing protein [Candidatus Omnitrophota bacterium]HQB94386.1 NADH-ubiquinone oxidoreductase-F iron-sulfur binding region domain-containing protein [Candidatus Omnitrophota bacterium]